ncbi:MAG: hypothetical protein AB8C84_11415 [Oligoflexales bacterium]
MKLDVFKHLQAGKSVELPLKYRGNDSCVVINWPDLTSASWSVGGVWGPSYSLEGDVFFEYKYFDIKKEKVQTYSLRVQDFCIASPFLARIRKRTPACIKLNDYFKNMKYELFFSPKGDLSEFQYEINDTYQGITSKRFI